MPITDKYSLEYSEKISPMIESLCEPLMYLNIEYFGYLKFFKDGAYFKISNSLDWTKYYLLNNLVDKSNIFAESLKDVPLSTLDIQLWPQSNENKKDYCLSSFYNFNIWNGINFSTVSEKYIEIFYFATNIENKDIINSYVKNMEALKRFILFFKQSIRETITASDEHTFASQTSYIPFFDLVMKLSRMTNKDQFMNNFTKETNIKRYYLNENCLSARECMCLKYLSTGKTTKEIGRILDISSRTVETHLKNIKQKTNTSYSSELIDMFLNSNLKDWVF